jgi:uncharacterized protein (TIGR03435 family)
MKLCAPKDLEHALSHLVICRVASLLAALSLAAPGGYGQVVPRPQPEFEVASVKLHPPGEGPTNVSVTTDPTRVTYLNVTVRSLLRQAYGLKIYPLSVPGDALSTDRYDVIAKRPPETSKEQTMLMLQALLKERFKLAVHLETKELPIYALVRGKNGPRFREAQNDGSAPEIGSGGGHRIKAHHISMRALARTLQDYIGDSVEDRTGLTGLYDLSLDFTPDENLSADGECVFGAVQRQLGLKLEMQKGPVDVVVVDHIQRPSEN